MYNTASLNQLYLCSFIKREHHRGHINCKYPITNNLKCAAKLSDFYFISDGVRLRATRGGSADPRTFSSRRSSTDSSEDGFNINVRDLKVIYALSCTSSENLTAKITIIVVICINI